MGDKSFFKERTIREIQRLKIKKVSRQKNLVEKINSLDPVEDALEIRTQIIPGKFFIGVETGKDASRKCLKHGPSILLPHPLTWSDCYRCPEIPLSMRDRAF